MGKRSEGREAAVQYLFAQDVHDGTGALTTEELHGFWELHSADKFVRDFAEHLIQGVRKNLAEIDSHIIRACSNFSIDRLGGVERNILRVGIYEFLYVTDLAAPIIINEGIEIAKKFCAADSGRFINGVLDRLGRELRPSEARPRRAQQPRAAGRVK